MNNQSFLERRVTGVFGIFMITVYAILGLLILFVVDLQWLLSKGITSMLLELPQTNRIVIGIALLLYAAFRTYMIFRFRARMKNSIQDETR